MKRLLPGMPVSEHFGEWLKGKKQRVVRAPEGGLDWLTPSVKKTDELRSAYYAEFPERL